MKFKVGDVVTVPFQGKLIKAIIKNILDTSFNTPYIYVIQIGHIDYATLGSYMKLDNSFQIKKRLGIK